MEMRKLYYYVYKLKLAGLSIDKDDPFDPDDPNDSRFTFYKPDGHEKEIYNRLDEMAYRRNST